MMKKTIILEINNTMDYIYIKPGFVKTRMQCKFLFLNDITYIVKF